MLALSKLPGDRIWRMIRHLSKHENDGHSTNDCVDSDKFPTTYFTASWVSQFVGCHLVYYCGVPCPCVCWPLCYCCGQLALSLVVSQPGLCWPVCLVLDGQLAWMIWLMSQLAPVLFCRPVCMWWLSLGCVSMCGMSGDHCSHHPLGGGTPCIYAFDLAYLHLLNLFESPLVLLLTHWIS